MVKVKIDYTTASLGGKYRRVEDPPLGSVVAVRTGENNMFFGLVTSLGIFSLVGAGLIEATGLGVYLLPEGTTVELT